MTQTQVKTRYESRILAVERTSVRYHLTQRPLWRTKVSSTIANLYLLIAI